MQKRLPRFKSTSMLSLDLSQVVEFLLILVRNFISFSEKDFIKRVPDNNTRKDIVNKKHDGFIILGSLRKISLALIDFFIKFSTQSLLNVRKTRCPVLTMSSSEIKIFPESKQSLSFFLSFAEQDPRQRYDIFTSYLIGARPMPQHDTKLFIVSMATNQIVFVSLVVTLMLSLNFHDDSNYGV